MQVTCVVLGIGLLPTFNCMVLRAYYHCDCRQRSFAPELLSTLICLVVLDVVAFLYATWITLLLWALFLLCLYYHYCSGEYMLGGFLVACCFVAFLWCVYLMNYEDYTQLPFTYLLILIDVLLVFSSGFFRLLLIGLPFCDNCDHCDDSILRYTLIDASLTVASTVAAAAMTDVAEFRLIDTSAPVLAD